MVNNGLANCHKDYVNQKLNKENLVNEYVQKHHITGMEAAIKPAFMHSGEVDNFLMCISCF
mgnify:CR=1 FL=1